jgi:rhodanese-related sulfurtransferase
VDAVTFKKMVDEKKYTVLDLRTNDEIERHGKIKGAVQMDYLGKEVEKTLSTFDKNKTYLVYCAGGGRSADCAALMHNLGFKEIVNLEKGFDDWKRKGFEIQKN